MMKLSNFIPYWKTKFPLFNPLLIAAILVIAFLKIFNIDFDTYNKGGQFINIFLGPATIVLAVPLYKNLHLLKKNFLPIFAGIFIGSLVSVLSVISISIFLGLDNSLTISLLSKSVTTPIGIEITNSLKTAHSGEVLNLDKKTYLNVEVNKKALIKVILNGRELYECVAKKCNLLLTEIGKYRVEIFIGNKGFAYSNPIIVM